MRQWNLHKGADGENGDGERKMAFRQIIEYADALGDNLVVKFDTKKNVIKKGSILTVRSGQAAVFCHKGQIADVFSAGQYKLETNSLPLLGKLMGWKYGFVDVGVAEVYFVNTLQFVNCKWGTSNPILLNDAEFGAVRVRGFGSYSFRIVDAARFLQEVSGAGKTFGSEEVTGYIRSMVVGGVAEALGASSLAVQEMSANLTALTEGVKTLLSERFRTLGLDLTAFHFEGLSLPPELEKAVDESVKLSLLRKNIDVYTAKAQADAAVESARHAAKVQVVPVGGTVLGQTPQEIQTAKKRFCTQCGAMLAEGAKFCGECGAKQ